ncbi:MAG: hypothetical protein IH795_13415 [Bacteroidetes bacterium]|nr:hypothetical protein [Bacteroidota bacterium]
MKVVTTAGDFEITVKESSVEEDYIVLTGQMGVWDSKIYLDLSDVWFFTSLFLKPSVLMFIVKQPFKSLFGKSNK